MVVPLRPRNGKSCDLRGRSASCGSCHHLYGEATLSERFWQFTSCPGNVTEDI